MVVINPETGMPELPDGYFWRVHRPDSDGDLKVEIRRRTLFGSKSQKYSWSFWDYQAGPPSAETVLKVATRVYEDWTTSEAKMVGGRHLAGDYPPKRLTT